MEIAASKDNIIFLKAETQYELAATFMRLQEYYESPNPDFRKQRVNLEDYMDWYAEEYGNFTYTSDWNSFNVPGGKVRTFFERHAHDLLKKEQRLRDMLIPWLHGIADFYVIGVWKHDNTLDHEFSHAFYYLNTSYRAQQRHGIRNIPEEFMALVYADLGEQGYCEDVYEDEAIAYLATNTMADTVDQFEDVEIPWDEIAVMQVRFDKFYNKYKEDK